MSDVNEWLKERRRIHELGNNVLLRNSYEIERETDLGIRDAKAVEDGFNTLPTLLTAVEKVLELHTRIVTDEHIDGPTAVCEQCSEDRLFALWPCETVEAIEGAINE